MRDDRGKLLDILEAIEKIQERLSVDREAFLGDEMLQVWAVHHIEIIGEAASRLTKGFGTNILLFHGLTSPPCEISLFTSISGSISIRSGTRCF